MNKFMKAIIYLAIFTFLLTISSASVKSQNTAFSNVSIIDVKAGITIPNMTVVVKGDQILEVNSTKEAKIPIDSKVIDCTGKFMIPGLWDMHMHYVNDSIKTIPYDFYEPNLTEGEKSKIYAPIYLAFGITGIRELSGGIKTLKLREQVRTGEILGPQMEVGSPLLDGPVPLFPDAQVIAIDGPSKAKKVVSELHNQGFDFLKTYTFLSAESYRAIHERASDLDMEVSGEIPISISVWEAVKLGHKTLEHMTGIELACSRQQDSLRKKYILQIDRLNKNPNSENALDIWVRSEQEPLETLDPNLCQDLFEYIAENETWVVPTLILQYLVSNFDEYEVVNNPNLKYLLPWERDLNNVAEYFDPEAKMKKIHNYRMKIVGNLNKAGINILAGSDTPGGFRLHEELELLVNGGLSPLEALRTATINPAIYLNRENEIGSIESGKIADLVILNGNPLEDIRNIQEIETVIFQGNLLDRSKLDRMLNQLETKAKNWQD